VGFCFVGLGFVVVGLCLGLSFVVVGTLFNCVGLGFIVVGYVFCRSWHKKVATFLKLRWLRLINSYFRMDRLILDLYQ
jgi:hypothetical protein